MQPVTYWRSLTATQKHAYAKKLGTTVEYVRTHIFPPPHRKPDRGISSKRLMDWVDASHEFGKRDANFSLEELVEHLAQAAGDEDAA